MQYEKAFSYQFEDQQWPAKLGLGAVISLIPILSFALMGYMVAIMRNLAARAEQPLPEWDHLDRKFIDGLILTLASLVYSAPVLVALGIPISMLAASGALASSGAAPDWGRVLGGAGWLVFACVAALFILYTLLLSIIWPAILVIFSRDGTFASCFNLQDVFQLITRHARPFFTAWLILMLASFCIATVLGFANALLSWIPCFGWIASLVLGLGSAVYIVTIQAHLFGQFRLLALEGQAPNIPV